MGATVGYRELASYRRHNGAEATVRHLLEHLKAKKLRPADFSIRELAMGLVEDGEWWVERLSRPKSTSLLEANHAVDTSQFTGITGQIFFEAILDSYETPDLLW